MGGLKQSMLDSPVCRNKTLVLIARVAKGMRDIESTHLAAGVAYYALFSLFPLLLGLIAILSFFLESEQIQSQVIELTGGFLPGSELLVQDNIDAAVGGSIN